MDDEGRAQGRNSEGGHEQGGNRCDTHYEKLFVVSSGEFGTMACASERASGPRCFLLKGRREFNAPLSMIQYVNRTSIGHTDVLGGAFRISLLRIYEGISTEWNTKPRTSQSLIVHHNESKHAGRQSARFKTATLH
jgi:hypothetical protein